MTLRESFIANNPGFPLLEAGELEVLADLARSEKWLEADETVLASERAGEGNMNLTLRVRTERRSLIVKQSRPWVEKYDQIEAPFDRARVEAAFYQRVSSIEPVAGRMPRLLASDPEHRVLVLEDLGAASDLSSLYGGDRLNREEIEGLGLYLSALHAATRGTFEEPEDAMLRNLEMRELNRHHIFEIPLDSANGLELDRFEPGLDRIAATLQADEVLREAARELGRRYMADGPVLLHGDFFPGSWIRTDRGLRVIDPEFCFFGDPEWDYGVALAHLAIAGCDHQGEELLARSEDELDSALIARFAGIEIVRRLIGVAQLPLEPTSGRRAELLERARGALTEGSLEVLSS